MNRKLYLAVGIGGMIGALCRYGFSLLLAGVYVFPYATITVNFIGCFFLSFLLNHSSIRGKFTPEIFTGLTTGIIGSFTTFSTFALETMEMWNENVVFAIVYTVMSIFGGLAFCYIGFKLSTRSQEAG